jgi:hypothetical protein
MRYFNMRCHPPLLIGHSMFRSEELEANTLLDKAQQTVSNLVDHDRRRQRHVQNSLPVLLRPQVSVFGVVCCFSPLFIHRVAPASLGLEADGNT